MIASVLLSVVRILADSVCKMVLLARSVNACLKNTELTQGNNAAHSLVMNAVTQYFAACFTLYKFLKNLLKYFYF